MVIWLIGSNHAVLYGAVSLIYFVVMRICTQSLAVLVLLVRNFICTMVWIRCCGIFMGVVSLLFIIMVIWLSKVLCKRCSSMGRSVDSVARSVLVAVFASPCSSAPSSFSIVVFDDGGSGHCYCALCVVGSVLGCFSNSWVVKVFDLVLLMLWVISTFYGRYVQSCM